MATITSWQEAKNAIIETMKAFNGVVRTTPHYANSTVIEDKEREISNNIKRLYSTIMNTSGSLEDVKSKIKSINEQIKTMSIPSAKPSEVGPFGDTIQRKQPESTTLVIPQSHPITAAPIQPSTEITLGESLRRLSNSIDARTQEEKLLNLYLQPGAIDLLKFNSMLGGGGGSLFGGGGSSFFGGYSPFGGGGSPFGGDSLFGGGGSLFGGMPCGMPFGGMSSMGGCGIPMLTFDGGCSSGSCSGGRKKRR